MSDSSDMNFPKEEEEGSNVYEYLVNHMKMHGNKVAQVAGYPAHRGGTGTGSSVGLALTFADLLELSRKLAEGLRSRGLGPGDVVVVLARSTPYYPFLLLGILETGATPHLVDDGSTPDQVVHAVSMSKAALALVSAATRFRKTEVVQALRRVVKDVVSVSVARVEPEPSRFELKLVSLGGSPAEGPAPTTASASGGSAQGSAVDSTPTLLGEAESQVQPQPARRPVPGGSGLALILASRELAPNRVLPSAVMISDQNLLAALRRWPTFVLPDDVVAGPLLFSEALGCLIMLMALCAGATVHTVNADYGNPRRICDRLLQAVSQLGITVVLATPPLLAQLCSDPWKRLPSLRSLRCLWIGNSPTSPQILSCVKRRLPHVTLHRCFCLAETFVAFAGEVRGDKPGSLGTLVEDMECKVSDPDTGYTQRTGVPGELCFRGAAVTSGYLNKTHGSGYTKVLIDSEGWLHSGLLGYVDQDGHYFVLELLNDELRFYESEEDVSADVSSEDVIVVVPGCEQAQLSPAVEPTTPKTPPTPTRPTTPTTPTTEDVSADVSEEDVIEVVPGSDQAQLPPVNPTTKVVPRSDQAVPPHPVNPTPTKLKDVLLQHPGVQQAFVSLTSPNAFSAVVVRAEGLNVSEGDLKKYIAEKSSEREPCVLACVTFSSKDDFSRMLADRGLWRRKFIRLKKSMRKRKAAAVKLEPEDTLHGSPPKRIRHDGFVDEKKMCWT